MLMPFKKTAQTDNDQDETAEPQTRDLGLANIRSAFEINNIQKDRVTWHSAVDACQPLSFLLPSSGPGGRWFKSTRPTTQSRKTRCARLQAQATRLILSGLSPSNLTEKAKRKTALPDLPIKGPVKTAK